MTTRRINRRRRSISRQKRSATKVIEVIHPDLVLTGVQAHDDLDGSVGPRLAEQLGVPYVGYVAGVDVKGQKATIRKEFPGGLVARMEVNLPAVLGIQVAEKPPRYVPISKVRQVMKTARLEETPGEGSESVASPIVSRMSQPEASKRATIIDGDVDEVVAKLLDIFKEAGIL
jgi:electron transfer flavoprotein beta subunit